MKHLYTSKRMSKVFSGLVLALAVILVACGSDSDEPESTATADVGQEQDAQPTVPPLDDEGTPDTSVSEDEITVLEADIPATAEASTPEIDDEVEEAEIVSGDPESTPQTTPAESEPETEPATAAVDDGEATTTADIAVDDEEATTAADIAAEDEGSASDATAEADLVTGEEPNAEPESNEVATADASDDVDTDVTEDTAEADSTPEPTVRARTGDETFNHPGDGTGGSGMPGELDSTDEGDGDPGATPESSPIAQLEISGCDVPDVPGFLGDSNVFELTADVNFRSGPGVDCEPVFEESVGEGQIVLVLGGPVTQTDDGSEWVQIEVNDEPGWISTDFIEPSE